MPIETITRKGKKFVLIEEAEYKKLASLRDADLPALPQPDADGNYPAVAASRVVLARKVIEARRAAGLTQVELAGLAGVRPETVNRLERARHTPDLATLNKINRALDKALAKGSRHAK